MPVTNVSKYALSCKFCIIVIISLWAFLPSATYTAQLAYETYTNVKVGELVKSFKKSEKGKVYVFIDNNLCDIEVKSVNNVLKKLDTSKLQVIIFFRASDQNYIKQRYPGLRNYTVITDIIGAYSNLYSIKKYPVVLLIDNKSIVNFIGIPGKIGLFDDEAYNKLVINVSKNAHTKDLKGLKLVEEYPIQGIDKKYLPFKPFIVRKLQDGVIIEDINKKYLAMIDRKGKVDQIVRLSEKIKNISIPVLCAGNIRKDRIILNDFSQNGKATLFCYDYYSDTVKLITSMPKDSFHFSWYIGFYLNDSLIVNGLFPNKYALSNNNDNSQACDIKGSFKGYFGEFEDINRLFNINSYYHNAYCSDNKGNLYEMESQSDTIRVFNKNLKHINSIYVNFDSTFYWHEWKSVFGKKGQNIPLTERMALGDSITRLDEQNGLLYDKKNDQIYVIYQKQSYDETGLTYNQIYVHKLSASKKRYSDIALPKRCFPFSIEGGVIEAVEDTESGLFYRKYKLLFQDRPRNKRAS